MTVPIIQSIDRNSYRAALHKFDAAVCEAIAVSQATASRLVSPNVGYATYVFTRMCGTGMAMVKAAPLSRWVRSDFGDWHFGSVAGHARSILDGYLLFSYLIEPAQSEDELTTRINVMHLNDCTRRIDFHTNIGNMEELNWFEEQRSILQNRLKTNAYFSLLPRDVQKQCLKGKYLMTDTRDSMLSRVGFAKGQFDAIYDLWSQHIHILPLSFYRIEPNGRGTGIENDVDRTYIAQALELSACILEAVTDTLVEQFPDASVVRKGIKSKFSPGPLSNRPKHGEKNLGKFESKENFDFGKTKVSAAIHKTWGE